MKVKQALDSLFSRGLIYQYIKEFLTFYSPRAADLLPKTHKAGHPGRPTVAWNGTPVENNPICRSFLQPGLARILSHIKGQNLLPYQAKRIAPPLTKTLLASIHIASLYTNIPHQARITACEEGLDLRHQPTAPTTDFCHLIKLPYF